jgi:mRNA-degrading endonuclease RelE of RelBE toxin-antitoxin system
VIRRITSSPARVSSLEKWPEVSGAKPLTGDLAGFFRMRAGDYRLQFRVEGENVIVVKVGHRDRFYED